MRIRVATNGLPNHCYFSPGDQPTEQNVDFEVNWLSPATQNADSSPTDQDGLNTLICDDLKIS